MNLRALTLSITVLGISFASARAAAQEDDLFEMSLPELLEVKVGVGSFFEERNLDVGSSVTSIREEDWEKRGARRLLDAIELTPSVSINQFLTPVPVIRGFAKRGVSGTLMTIDGMPMNQYLSNSFLYTASDVNLGVLDKIDLLRGPGSALYGTDAFSGVLALTTRELKKERTTLKAGGGSFGAYQASATVSREVSPRLWTLISAAVNGQTGRNFDYPHFKPGPDTLTDNKPPTTLDPADVPAHVKQRDAAQTVVAKIGYDETELAAYWHHFNQSGLIMPSGAGYYGEQSSPRGQFAALKLSHVFSLPGDVKLTATAFGHRSTGFVRQSDVNAEGNLQLDNQQNFIQDVEGTRYGTSWIARKTVTGFPVKFALGYSYDYLKVNRDNFIVEGPGVTIRGDDTGSVELVNALFAQTNTDLFDNRFHIVLGGRLDRTNIYGTQVTPRAGLIYQTTPVSAVKLLYNNAFLAPFAQSRFGLAAGGFIGDPNLRPETLHAYELVYMSQTKKARYEATAYYTDWRNTITLQNDPSLPPNLSKYVNSGRNKGYGLELEGDFEVAPRLSFVSSGSYNRSFEIIGGAKTDLPSFPTYILNWGADYRVKGLPLGVHLRNRHQFLQRAEVAQPNFSSTFEKVRPYFRTDLGADWDFGKAPRQLQVSAHVRNLLNRENFILPTLVGARDGGFPDAGRSFLLEARASL